MAWEDCVERDEFADVNDADELCRRLLASSGFGGSRTRHEDAVEVLARVRGTGGPGEGFATLLLCTSPRWDRATGRLIEAIERAGLLADDELDELAEAFLADAVEVVHPLAWVWPEWLGVDLDDPGGGRAYRVDEDTPARALRHVRPPLRRWAARRMLAACPARLHELLARAERLEPHGRAAAVLGLLDAATVLSADERRQLARVGLATGLARVRRAALELVSELDGPNAALSRARSDPDATVRAWRPRSSQRADALSLL